MSALSGLSFPTTALTIPAARPVGVNPGGTYPSPDPAQLALLALALQQQQPPVLAQPVQSPQAGSPLLPSALSPVVQAHTAVAQPLPPITGPIPLTGDPLTTPAALPEAALIKSRLNWGDTIVQGARRGVVMGAAIAPILLGLNYWLHKPSLLAAQFLKEAGHSASNALVKEATPATAQVLGAMPEISGQSMMDLFVGSFNLPEAGRSIRQRIETEGLSKHWKALLADTAGTLVDSVALGGALGSTIALMQVGEVKDRLIHIRQEALGLAPGHQGPVTAWQDRQHPSTPQEKLDRLKQGPLDPTHAFGEGVKNTIIVKGILGIGSNLLILPFIIPWMASDTARQTGQPLTQTLWPTTKQVCGQLAQVGLKFLKQPLFAAQLVVLPVMGGLIGKQLVPWMNQQLGRSEQPPKESPSATTPTSPFNGQDQAVILPSGLTATASV